MSSSSRQIAVEPVISYPRVAQTSKTYLMTVDLRLVEGSEWPYESEEYALYCIVDSLPLFSNEPIGAGAVVLHRFGGTYGPATFLLTASDQPQRGRITVTLVSEAGMPIETIAIDDIHVAEEIPLAEPVAIRREVPQPLPVSSQSVRQPSDSWGMLLDPPFAPGQDSTGKYTETELKLLSYRPTLILGLGGTGYSVVRKLKRLIQARFDEREAETFQFLAFDTNAQAAPSGEPDLDQGEYVDLGVFAAQRIIQNLDASPYIKEWWPVRYEPAHQLAAGSGLVRAVGRLALLYNLERKVLPAISAKLRRALDIEVAKMGRKSSIVKVYIATSLAGGTGSGMFLDLAYIVRHELQRFGINSCYITGILFMPDIFAPLMGSANQLERLQANAFAALEEVDYFMRHPEFKVQYSERYSISPLPVNSRPFDLCYLIGRHNERNRSVEGPDSATDMVAQGVMMEILSPMSGEGTNRLDSIQAAKGQGREYPIAYSSFGVSSLTYPVSPVMAWCALRSVATFIIGGILKPIRPQGQAAEEAGNFVDAHSLIETRLDSLITSLQCDQSGKRLQLNKLTFTDVSRLHDNLVIERLDRGQARDERALQAAKREITQRAREKIEGGEREIGATQAMQEQIFHLLTDAECGPLYALWFTEELQDNLRAYRDREMQGERHEYQRTIEYLQDSLVGAREELIQALSMPGIYFWRRSVRDRHLRSFVDAYNGYFESSLQAHLREEAMRVYDHLINELDQCVEQLKALVDEFKIGAKECESRAASSVAWITGTRYALESNIVSRDKLQTIYEQHRPDFSDEYVRRDFVARFWMHLDAAVPGWRLGQPIPAREGSLTEQVYKLLGNHFAHFVGQKTLLQMMEETYGENWLGHVAKQFEDAAPFWKHTYEQEIDLVLGHPPVLIGYGEEDSKAHWSREISQVLQTEVIPVRTKNPYEMILMRTTHGLPLSVLQDYQTTMRDAYNHLQQEWEVKGRAIPLHASSVWEEAIKKGRSPQTGGTRTKG